MTSFQLNVFSLDLIPLTTSIRRLAYSSVTVALWSDRVMGIGSDTSGQIYQGNSIVQMCSAIWVCGCSLCSSAARVRWQIIAWLAPVCVWRTARGGLQQRDSLRSAVRRWSCCVSVVCQWCHDRCVIINSTITSLLGVITSKLEETYHSILHLPEVIAVYVTQL